MRTKTTTILFFCFHMFSGAFAQTNPQPVNQIAPPHKTYAVIVGISSYENPGITQLDFAHKDAEVFANYLKSKAGGSVPEENIRLLLNENATYASIYDALNWLLESCQKDDVAYFYFSGHGDMENSTIYKLGFLLSYNTPRTNYMNNAVRIEDLNNIANTLSITNQSRVILITDACHSGKLSGSDFRGSFLVGQQLRTTQSSEVRIASCGPDELSMEDRGWGDGRGVFSYYLVKGLEGLADYNHDEIVTVNEIKTYLDSSLAVDPLLVERAHKQTPFIKGLEKLKLASVDDSTLNFIRKGSLTAFSGASTRPMLKAVPVPPQAYFFNLVAASDLEKVDFGKLSEYSKDEIPFEFIKMIATSDSLFDRAKGAVDSEKISLLEKSLREHKDAVERFNSKLAVMLSDIGQTVINQYIEGDEAELERRRYYNSNSNGYDIYPKMFAVALKITKPEDYLYRILQVKYHYFSGVAARLKIPTVEDPRALIEYSISEQKKALELEENAADIQNEMGVLSEYKNNYKAAEQYYLRATQIAPAWVVPWANLVGLYSLAKNSQKAMEAFEKARKLQPGFQGTYVNGGLVYENEGNQLLAEEFFRKAIKINSRHYLPFERLGYVYMKTTQYAAADSFFYEAEKRKKGYHFVYAPKHMKLPKPVIEVLPVSFCNLDTLDIGKNDVLGHFAWGISEYSQNPGKSEREFRKTIELDKTNPLAFHYLGKLLYYQQRWAEADIVFNLALTDYLDDSALNRYYDSLAAKLPETPSKECILSYFRMSFYAKVEDHYFLATLYQSWNHYSEAEQHYRAIISIDPQFIGGYYKLWKMLESIGRYKDAEDVLRSYAFRDTSNGERELNAFYQRMMARFPGEGDWFYKAGVFLYHYAEKNPEIFHFDEKTVLPDDTAESYVYDDISNLYQNSEGVRRKFILPGIEESILIAPKIYHPWTTAITSLLQADSLLAGNDDASADINYKVGDLYTWQGLPEKAALYYRKSVDLKPDDANTRIKLIERYSTVYYLQDAMEQLDSLYARKEINFPMQLLLSTYCIHSGRLPEALKLLKEAQQMHPFRIPAIADLNGRLQLFLNHQKEALAFYQDYLGQQPGDSLTMYTIARLFAQMKNTAQAWKWLKLSIDSGFNYYWVLKYDAAWDGLRRQQKWKELTAKIPVPEL